MGEVLKDGDLTGKLLGNIVGGEERGLTQICVIMYSPGEEGGEKEREKGGKRGTRCQQHMKVGHRLQTLFDGESHSRSDSAIWSGLNHYFP